MRQRRMRGQQQFGDEEAEITRLQAIEDEIGTPRGAARYDQANPQNELLTIQPSPSDRWLDPKQRANLVSAWLVAELGRDRCCPLPSAWDFGHDPRASSQSWCGFCPVSPAPTPSQKWSRRRAAARPRDSPVAALPEVAELESLLSTREPATPGPLSHEPCSKEESTDG